MNGHPRDQAKVSVHCRWSLIRGTDWHVEMSPGIDNMAVHSRWPLTTGVVQGRYYCCMKATRKAQGREYWQQPVAYIQPDFEHTDRCPEQL